MTTLVFQKGKPSRCSFSTKFFCIAFLLVSLMALFPPFYLYISSSRVIFAGLPIQVIYWLSIPVLSGICLWGFYMSESRTVAPLYGEEK